ncbi:MAG TPA: M1 family metallopeptidase, partial [Kofleriaceae bacterium]|nr:M1 family metallopeptidase [Kofleriaceae bacterium]
MRWLVLFVVACSAPVATTVPRPAARPTELPALRLPDDPVPLGYDLRLDVDPAREDFTGEVRIHLRAAHALDRIVLGAAELSVTRATLDGAPVTVAATSEQMIGFDVHMAAGDHVLTIAYGGRMTHDQEGLFRQEAEGRWYAFTQGESLLTRRYVPCLDEPRWKTPWRVTLVVPKGDVALANTPVEHETARGDVREVVFAETPPLPSYLLAVAVGPFAMVDAGVVGARKVPLRVAALAGLDKQVGVIARLSPVVAAIEAYVGTPLAWPKLDFVVVPHLFGAMENPGLITMDADMLVGDAKDDEAAHHFMRVAAHEIVHQWFGNSITPAWWDELWLAEAFATWLGDKVSAQLGALDDIALDHAIDREQALEADAEPDARPLHSHLARDDDPDDAFDAISYEKGAAVLATLEAYVGADAWRDKLRAYVAAHAGGTVTTQDMLDAIGGDAAAALASYLEHPGAPVVDVTATCERISLRPRDGRRVPVCVRTDKLPRTCALDIALHGCAAWIEANDGAGYYAVAGTLPAPPLAKLSPQERVAAGDDIALALYRGELPAAAALAELRRLAESKDVYARLGALAIARTLDPLVSPAQREAWDAWLGARFADRLSVQALLSPSRPAERELRDRLLLLVTAPRETRLRARELLAALMTKGDPPPELVAVAAPEAATLAQMAKTAELDPTRRDALLDALAAGPPQGIDVAIDLVAVRRVPAWAAISGYFDRGATRAQAWAALRGKLADVLSALPAADRAQVIDAVAQLCDDADGVETAFAPRLADIPGGRRAAASRPGVRARLSRARTRPP